MILICTESGKSFDFPSSWDELSPRQIRHLWKIQDKCLRSGASPMEFSIRVLFRLLGMKPPSTARPSEKFCENVYMLCEQCLGFLFGDGATLQYASTRNPIPKMGFRRGPGEMLQKLTFGEFRHAAVAMKAYTEGHDTADLDECIAILWRTPCLKTNKAGRRATPPGSLMFKMDLAAARHTAPWKKSLALASFCWTMQYLQSGKLILDGEQVDLSLLFSSPGKSNGPECSWNDLLVQLARDGILGTADKVDEEPVLSIFSIMWSNYKEAKRYEETLKAKNCK